jgi:hypothetical protein
LERIVAEFFQAKAQASALQLHTSTAPAVIASIGRAQAGDGPMVKTFCTSGESEALKGAVHALGGVLAATTRACGDRRSSTASARISCRSTATSAASA